MKVSIAFLLFCTACSSVVAQPLARRGDTGAAVRPPADGKPASIVRFRPESVLERAGLKVGDAIVALDGQPLATGADFERWRRLKARSGLRVSARRGETPIEVTVDVPPMREEAIDGVQVRYGEARSEKGYRVRT